MSDEPCKLHDMYWCANKEQAEYEATVNPQEEPDE